MSQEAEEEINFESLKAIVEKAIKNKDTSAIEIIKDDSHLRYMQKYTELQVSEDESRISSSSLFFGIKGLSAAVFAIGVSVFLTGASSVPKEVFTILGVIMMGFGVWYMYKTPKAQKEFEKIEEEADFMRDLILKIEEKLANKI